MTEKLSSKSKLGFMFYDHPSDHGYSMLHPAAESGRGMRIIDKDYILFTAAWTIRAGECTAKNITGAMKDMRPDPTATYVLLVKNVTRWFGQTYMFKWCPVDEKGMIFGNMELPEDGTVIVDPDQEKVCVCYRVDEVANMMCVSLKHALENIKSRVRADERIEKEQLANGKKILEKLSKAQSGNLK